MPWLISYRSRMVTIQPSETSDTGGHPAWAHGDTERVEVISMHPARWLREQNDRLSRVLIERERDTYAQQVVCIQLAIEAPEEAT